MSNEQTIGAAVPDTIAQDAHRPALMKKIGKTTYKITVHFSTAGTETVQDKIKRMLRNEIQNI